MIKKFLALFFGLFLFTGLYQASAQNNKPQVLLRLDDCGMNHSVNAATEEMAKTGIPFSTSIMFACPWYQEAVALLKKYPHVSVGVHLTITSEWQYYRWGPILGKAVVPSLVDSLGYFYPSNDAVKKHCKPEEVEMELSAQIERALHSGLKIDYIDYHMAAAVSTPALRAVFERLSKKYNLAMSWYFGEDKFPMPTKGTTHEVLYNHLNELKTDRVNLIVFHIAKADPEMNAIVSLNRPGPTKSIVAEQRSSLLNLLIAKEFKDLFDQKKYQFITYRDLVQKLGLKGMHAPPESEWMANQ